MRSYKVYYWDGRSLDALWCLADTREVAGKMMAKLWAEGAKCVVVLGPDWQVIDSKSDGEGASLDDVLGRGRHGS